MGQDYPLTEFANNLAKIEFRFAQEFATAIECFTSSRVDLPVKKLEELSRIHSRNTRNLQKLDNKKDELVNLWKVCNVYSASAVDMDNAMREIRKVLRGRIKRDEKKGDSPKRSSDDYSPALTEPQETYDNYKPPKDAKKFLNTLFRRESKKPVDQPPVVHRETAVLQPLVISRRPPPVPLTKKPPLPPGKPTKLSPSEPSQPPLYDAQRAENLVRLDIAVSSKPQEQVNVPQNTSETNLKQFGGNTTVVSTSSISLEGQSSPPIAPVRAQKMKMSNGIANQVSRTTTCITIEHPPSPTPMIRKGDDRVTEIQTENPHRVASQRANVCSDPH